MKTVRVADLFCGAGGTSSGAEQALREMGREMELVAVNHWDVAVDTHRRNLPGATHVLEDVNLVKPRDAVPGGRLDLLMASPECTGFSRAKGGLPLHDQGRMNAWAIVRWLTDLRVERLLVENVPEFVRWGPLDDDDRPDADRLGMHFQAWVKTIRELGYRVEWRTLNSADYGDATSRVRFFLQGRLDGRPVNWPEPTHARNPNPMFPGRAPWRGAREVIDRDDPGRSLLDDPRYARKPLAVRTRQRIARGMWKYFGEMAHLYVRLLDLPPGEEHPPGKPEKAAALVIGQQSGSEARPWDRPLPTIAGKGAISITRPVVMGLPEPSTSRGPALVGYYRDTGSPEVRWMKVRETTPDGILVQYYSNGKCCTGTGDPLPTVTTKDRHGLATPTLSAIGQCRPGDAFHQAREAGLDPRRVVFLEDRPHLLDLRFRMLNNRELARAMGFDDGERTYEFAGNRGQVTRQIGNAVPVNLARALVREILK